MADRPKKHTKDLAQRAVDIADREASKVWRETGNRRFSFATWIKTFEAALKEFGWSETVTE
jgi:hypothetical protein